LRLIAMDRPGMGRSSYEAARTLRSWPGLIERFADAQGIGRFGQLAVSGGAPYALACAAEIPDRLTGSAILAGAVPLTGPGNGLHPIYNLLIPLRKWLPCPAFTAVFRLAGMASRLPPTQAPMSWLLKSLSVEDQRLLFRYPEIWEVIGVSFREGVRGGGGRGIMADAEIYLQPFPYDPAAIRHPLRFWHGADDRNIPLDLVRNFLVQVPGARLEVAESLGHFSLVITKAPAALDHLADRA
jgi:pimeloyl-ACP methyl ester carboxylesterase